MNKLFQNVGIFYGTLVVVAIALQWFVADAYKAEIKAMDDKAAAPVKQIAEHYASPSGAPVEQLKGELNVLEKKILDGFKKLQDQINFRGAPEYRVDAKAGYPQIEYQQRVDKFKTKNSKRLKALAGKFSPAFLGINQELTVEKANELLFQASILEELLARLENAGAFPFVESISANPPRAEQIELTGKIIKRLVRYPMLVEFTADFSTLDKIFGALQSGKGYFFLDNLELTHANEPDQWDDRIRCKAFLVAIALDFENQIDAPPIRPAWASSVAR